jgi:hypothetical protein
MKKRGAGARGRTMKKRNTAQLQKTKNTPKKSKTTRKLRARRKRPRITDIIDDITPFQPLLEKPTLLSGKQLSLPLCDHTEVTLEAYSEPDSFESQQQSNGHLTAQKEILGLFHRYIGSKIVSLASGTGWLDRELVYLKERELHRGGTLRLLGIDLTPENTRSAQEEMQSIISRNSIINRAFSEGRFSYQYINARLGSSKTIKDQSGNEIFVPSFSEIDLRKTVIGSKSADTYLIFMALVIWVHEREATIAAIADRSHKAGPKINPTYVINGEEYPTHITPNDFLRPDFEEAVEKNKQDEVSTDHLWDTLFPLAGFRQIPGARCVVNFSDSTEDHALQGTALRYEGGSNPFGFKKVQ